MKKIKAVTMEGALKLLNISNRTFYEKYRPLLKPIATVKKRNFYALEDIRKLQSKHNGVPLEDIEIVDP